MSVRIKLKRIGKMREPHYRIVVADARTKRSGRAIEELGEYHPVENPSRIQVDSPRVQYWLGVGAQPTEAVAAILRVTGDWQAFKGEPAPPPMLVAEPAADKRSVFEAAAKEAAGLSDAPARPARKAAPKAAKAEAAAATAPEAAATAPEAAATAPEAAATAPEASSEPGASEDAPPAETAAAEAGADEASTTAEA